MVHNNSSLLLICGVMFMAFISNGSRVYRERKNINERHQIRNTIRMFVTLPFLKLTCQLKHKENEHIELCREVGKCKTTNCKYAVLCNRKYQTKKDIHACIEDELLSCANYGNTRKRRYTMQESLWKKEVLTWKLINDNNDKLSRQAVERVLETAFNKWQNVTNLTFRKSSSDNSDIKVTFANKGDRICNLTDGNGGYFGHAFYPNDQGISVNIHIDDGEKFSIGKSTGLNLLWIAVHEIGHSIGLGHSDVKEAVMYPLYGGNGERDFPLHYDDQIAAQTLYGPVHPGNKMTTGCTDTFKAVFLDKTTQKTYVINNDEVYVLTSNLNIEKGPIHISEVFSRVQKVDAAYEKGNGDIVLFSDNKYYTYNGVGNGRFNDSGSIHDKYNGLNRNIKRIDAAFNWPDNGRTYLFVGKNCYSYNERTGKIGAGYAIVDGWNGIPANVDAVFVWRDKAIYFFKGAQYYRFNNIKIRVETDYPRLISPIWTSCEVNSLQEEEDVGTLVVAIITSVIILIAALVIALLCFLKHRGVFRRSEGTTQRRFLMRLLSGGNNDNANVNV